MAVNVAREGDRYLWNGVKIMVTRVGKNGLWADIACWTGNPQTDNPSWTKRQPLLSGGFPDDNWVPATEDWNPAPREPDSASLGLPVADSAFPTGML